MTAAIQFEDGDVDIELARQLLLPLAACGLGREYQRALGAALVDAGFQEDACLDCLAEAYFVGYQDAVAVVADILIPEEEREMWQCREREWGGKTFVDCILDTELAKTPTPMYSMLDMGDAPMPSSGD